MSLSCAPMVDDVVLGVLLRPSSQIIMIMNGVSLSTTTFGYSKRSVWKVFSRV